MTHVNPAHLKVGLNESKREVLKVNKWLVVSKIQGPNSATQQNQPKVAFVASEDNWPRVVNLFFVLKSNKHENFPAHKC